MVETASKSILQSIIEGEDILRVKFGNIRSNDKESDLYSKNFLITDDAPFTFVMPDFCVQYVVIDDVERIKL